MLEFFGLICAIGLGVFLKMKFDPDNTAYSCLDPDCNCSFAKGPDCIHK